MLRTDPTSYFFYIKENGFIKHEVHKGKDFYKHFSAFILSTTLDHPNVYIESLNDNIIFIPKYYNNIRLVSKIKSLKGITLKGYDAHSEDMPKHLARFLNVISTLDLDPDNISKRIDVINNNIPSISENVKNIVSKRVPVKPQKTQKRSYSTNNKSTTGDVLSPNQNIRPSHRTDANGTELNISVLQVLGLDPSKIHITKECTIDNKPLSWSKDSEKYVVCPSLHKLDADFIKRDIYSTFKDNGTYSIMPTIYNKSNPYGQQCISLSKHILVTKALEPSTIIKFYQHRVEVLSSSYSGADFCGEVIFRIILISESPKVYKSTTEIGISDSKPNRHPKLGLTTYGYTVNTTSVSKVDKRSYSTMYKTLNNLTYSDNRTDNPNNVYGVGHIYLTPLSTDLAQYGTEILEGTLYDIYKDKGVLYQFNQNIILLVHNQKDIKDGLVVRFVTVFNQGVYTFDYQDIFPSDGSTTIFTREHSGVKTYICSSTREVLYYDRPLNPLYIKPRKAKNIKDKKISSFDIETYTSPSGLLVPYACGWYNGVTGKHKTYYITDYKNDCDIMLSSALIDLLASRPGTVYTHNLSKFDAYFILKIIYRIFDVKPMYKDRNILHLDLTLKTTKPNRNVYNKKRMVLKDSYLLLPESLKRLGTAFNTNIQKGYFPYDFVNKDRLEYIGMIPDYQYFKNQLTRTEYDVIKNNPASSIWDVKKETLKYLERDIKTLCEVLIKFSDEI
jgi:hypothetical protein